MRKCRRLVDLHRRVPGVGGGMMSVKMPVCTIEKQMRDNYLTLFEELKEVADKSDGWFFLAWYKENRFLIEQSIDELNTVDIEYL
jgi:hypothetical protein